MSNQAGYSDIKAPKPSQEALEALAEFKQVTGLTE